MPPAPSRVKIRQMIVAAIGERHLMPGDAVPSSRELGEILGVARNTVVLAYQQLIDEGLLISEERSGCFVNPDTKSGWAAEAPRGCLPVRRRVVSSGLLGGAVRARAFEPAQISEPLNWQRHPYPFVCGQFDPSDCSRWRTGANVRAWRSASPKCATGRPIS